jgi:hypothetical protein
MSGWDENSSVRLNRPEAPEMAGLGHKKAGIKRTGFFHLLAVGR